VPAEHPVSELDANREDVPEEPTLDEPVELQQAGEPELVLDDAVFDAGSLGGPGDLHGRL
jgi:hypothetical protein